VPTYQYVCTACDQPLEAVQSFSDAALTECPHCGGRLRKVYGAVGVVFKGSGFYKNDSRSEKKPAAADGGAKTDAGGADSGAKESGKKDAPATPAAAPAASSSPAPSSSSGGSSSSGSAKAPAGKSA
jgi:putative FmdB family regulatory protein